MSCDLHFSSAWDDQVIMSADYMKVRSACSSCQVRVTLF